MPLPRTLVLFFRRPVSFFGRQVYRVFIIWPYEVLVSLFIRSGAPSAAKAPPSQAVCVVITSVIHCSQKRLTYSALRSFFEPSERTQQTLVTIQSVRTYIPNATIVLLEAGLEAHVPEVEKAVDHYVYVGSRPWVRSACNSRFKSLGEVSMLLAGYPKLPPAAYYLKISGRYWLNDFFRVDSWKNRSFTFFHIRPDFVSTRVYSFAYGMKKYWRLALIKSLPYLFLDYPIEYLLHKFVPAQYVTKAARVGVTGFDGVNGKEVSE